jgi:hypothetical protein
VPVVRAIAVVLMLMLASGCGRHPHPTCHIPAVPPIGTSGPVDLVRGEVGGGSLSTTFGGRLWAMVAPSTPSSTHISGHATVVAADPNPELRVVTGDGRTRTLKLVLAACL